MKKKTLTKIFELCLVLCVVMLFTLCSCEKHNHNYDSNWSINEDYHFHKCEGCEEITDKEAHIWNDAVITKEATETIEGEKTYICTVCGKTKIEKIVASKGLEFELSDTKDSYIVVGLGTCEDNHIVIPSTYEGLPITSIGDWAFFDCISLTSIVIPEGVTCIEEFAFLGCSSLISIVIPKSVRSIIDNAFTGCISLTSIIVDKNNKVYDSRENCNTIIETSTNTLIAGCQNTIIPNSITSIGDSAFFWCSNLTSLVIPNSVTSIGYGAFSGCSNLTSIIVDKNNKVYDSRENCNAIIETSSNTLITGCRNTEILDSVTSIGKYAFKDCSNLTSITIPNSVTSIEESAFNGCSNLTSIIVDKNNKVYDSKENCNAIIETSSNTLVVGCQNTVIPNSVTSIGNSAFDGCSNLTSITIPNSVASIGNWAFSGCINLTSITIPNSVTSIGRYAFNGCSNLTSIEIPNSVTNIGYLAFSGCSSLTIYCEANNEPYGFEYYWNPDGRPVIWGYKK